MAGRPMVATEVGGVPEVVRPPYGILVAPGRPMEMADAVVALASDRAALGRLGEQARKAMLDAYTLDVFLDRHRALYEEAVRRVRDQ